MVKRKSVEKIEDRTPILKVHAVHRETIKFTVVGTTPLLVNRFSVEKMIEIDATPAKGTAEPKTKPKPKALSPHEQYLNSRYMIGDTHHGIPVGAFKKAMIGAIRQVDSVTMVAAQPLFHSMPLLIHDEYYPLTFKKVEHNVHIIKNQNTGGRRPVHRAMYTDWSCDVVIEFDATQFSGEEMANLLSLAGTVGVGAFRPSCGGYYGQFKLKTEKGRKVT